MKRVEFARRIDLKRHINGYKIDLDILEKQGLSSRGSEIRVIKARINELHTQLKKTA